MSTSKSNDGKWLEDFVADIEGLLVQQGFKVEKRVRQYDGGVQTGEADIVISGQIGSASVKFLIACRDRPSEGRAPKAWISELVGVLHDGEYDKIMAVSSTGFSRPAEKKAKRDNIALRIVGDLSVEDVSSWFKIEQFTVSINWWILKHFHIYTYEDFPAEQMPVLLGQLNAAGFNTPLLRHPTANRVLSVSDFVQGYVDNTPEMFEGLVPNGDSKLEKCMVDFRNEERKFAIKCGNELAIVGAITFECELSIVEQVVPITRISQYVDHATGRPIAQSVQYRAKVDEFDLELGLHAIPGKGITSLGQVNEQASNTSEQVTPKVKRKRRSGG